jgi:hypothetical protein
MNRSLLRSLCANLGVAWLATPPLQAACPSGTALQSIEPGVPSIAVTLPSLPVGSTRAIFAVNHGTASLTPTRLVFAPKPSFWSVGTTTVIVQTSIGSTLGFDRYWIVAGGRRIDASWLPFDFAGLTSFWSQSGSASEMLELSAAAFRGTSGMRFPAGATSNPHLEGRPSRWTPGHGDTRSARSGRTALQGPPPTAGPEALSSELGMSLISSGLLGQVTFEVQVRNASGLQARLFDAPGQVAGAWTPLSPGPHQLELVNWFDTPDNPAGALLFVDGVVAQALNSTQLFADSETAPVMRFGRIGTAGNVGSFDLDDVSVAWSRGERFVCLAGTDFETGGYESPFTTFQGENLSVGATAGLVGSFGLRSSLAGAATGGQLQLAVPASPVAQRVGLRFRFDLDVTPFGLGDGPINLVEGLTSLGGPRAFRVQAVHTVGGLVLRVLGRSGDAILTSPGIPIGTGPHTVELDWQRSTTDLRATGYVRVWVDGNGAGAIELTQLDNDNVNLTNLRIGAVAATTTAPEGSVLIDEILVWKEN